MRTRALAGGVVGVLIGAACGLADTGPIALDDRVAVQPGGTIVVDLLENDRAPIGESLALTSLTGGRGSATIVDDRRVEYIAPGSGATDSFTYRVTSSGGVEVGARVDVVIGETPTTTEPTTTVTTVTTSVPETTTTVAPGNSNRLEPDALDFGTVALGATVQRPVALVAGDEPWAPDWSEIDLVDGLQVQQDCATIAAGERCDVVFEWSAPTPTLDVTLWSGDDPDFRVFGTARSLEVVVDQVPVPVTLVRGGFGNVGVTITAPSDDPVVVRVGLADEPPGANIDPVCEVVRSSCSMEVVFPLDRFLPGENTPFDVVVTTSADEVTVGVTVVGELAAPVWLVPRAGQEVWFDTIGGSITVEIEPVFAAEDHELGARLCSGDDCGDELTVDQLGDSGRFVVVAPDLDQLQVLFEDAAAPSEQPTLELVARAVAGDRVSPPARLVVPLVDQPFAVRLIGHVPSAPVSCGTPISTTVEATSYLLEPVDVDATFSGKTTSTVTDRVVLEPGRDRVVFEVAPRTTFDTITLTSAGFPSSTVDGVAEYIVEQDCID